MIETSAWDSIRPILRELELDPVRVENVLHPGFPDVNYKHGLIELKYMDSFPVRPGTKVTVPKLKGEQVGFLLRRWQKGGLAFLLVRVGSEWFLWEGGDAYRVKQGLTQEEWRNEAALVLTPPLNIESRNRLRDVLTIGGVL